MLLYADEDFPHPSVHELIRLGHDVLTAQADGRSQAPDYEILNRAHTLGRIVLTYNRNDFERLDRQGLDHSGNISAKQDPNHLALAARVHLALLGRISGRWCIRVNRLP